MYGPPFLLREAFPPPPADPGRPTARVGRWVAAMVVLPAVPVPTVALVALLTR